MGQKSKQRQILSLRQREAAKAGRAWIARIQEENEEALTCDGFDDCILGVANRYGMAAVLAYDYDKVIEKLMSQGMSHEDAVEHFDFNIIGSWVGEGTPVFVSTRNP